jgi:hypothetical protein
LDPGIVDGQRRDPLALGVLDNLLGQVGQLAAGRPGLFAELLERRIRADPLSAGKHTLGLLDPNPADQRLPQLGHLDIPSGQFYPGVEQVGGHGRQRPQRVDLLR